MISELFLYEQIKIKLKIEILRSEMIRIGLHEGMTNEKTIQISKELDEFIVKYQLINNAIKNKQNSTKDGAQMIFPLINVENAIHIVKNENSCECGLTFNSDLKKEILKKIKFSSSQSVTCEKCLLRFNLNK